MIEIYGLKMEQVLPENQLEVLLTRLPENTQKEIKKLWSYEGAVRKLAGEYLLRYMVSRKTNLVFEEILVDKDRHGKPLLKNPGEVFLNVSHSGKWVVGAVGGCPLGIDIEKKKERSFKPAERFFTEPEKQLFFRKTREQKLEFFIDRWTLQESYVKAVGKGISLWSVGLDVIYYGESNGKIVCRDQNLPDAFFKKFDMDKEYKMTVNSLEDKEFGQPEVKDMVLFFSEMMKR